MTEAEEIAALEADRETLREAIRRDLTRNNSLRNLISGRADGRMGRDIWVASTKRASHWRAQRQ